MAAGLAAAAGVAVYCLWQADVLLSLLALLGGCLGWLTGILVVPLTKTEVSTFSVYAKVISGFVSGYALSKVDPLITHLLAIDPDSGVAPITQPYNAELGLTFLCSYLIALLVIFCARAYLSVPDFKPRSDPRAPKTEL